MLILLKEIMSDRKHAREATRQPMNNTSAMIAKYLARQGSSVMIIIKSDKK